MSEQPTQLDVWDALSANQAEADQLRAAEQKANRRELQRKAGMMEKTVRPVQTIIAEALAEITVRRERLEQIGEHLAEAKKAEAALLKLSRDLGMPSPRGQRRLTVVAQTTDKDKDFRPTENQQDVLVCIRSADHPLTIAQITKELGKESARGISAMCRSLVINGLLREVVDAEQEIVAFEAVAEAGT